MTAKKTTAKKTTKARPKVPKTTTKAVAKAASKPAAKAPAKAASGADRKSEKKTAPARDARRGKATAPRTEPTAEPSKALPRTAAKFKVGDHVVYPFHGVGVVKLIDRMDVTGESQWYYTLDFRNGELTVKLPVASQEDKGMRKVIVKSDVEKVMAVLKKKPPTEESDWKVRHGLYLEKLKSGDIYEAAKVARNLSKRGPEGELSMSEKRLLEAAVQQLVQEIAEAAREPIEKVETEISKCLRAGRQ